jgi:2-dehydropantoate 2-reductase
MTNADKIYVLGCGAIGLTLAACLVNAGRNVVAVRTSKSDVAPGEINITVRGAERELKVLVETISLVRLKMLDGIAVVTTKSYANKAIATTLVKKGFSGPIVILQNGLGVENPFIESGFTGIYRCVLYATAQIISENEVTFRSIASCPIGIVQGNKIDLAKCVNLLMASHFPFHAEDNIQHDIWKKAIINSVFNSICPLLEVDNGIFVRDEKVAQLAKEIVGECLVLAEAKGVSLAEPELMEQILRISNGSAGVLISTLQDIRNGRETEIESLNLEMAQMTSFIKPQIALTRTEFLGKMVLAKSKCQKIIT